MFDLRFDKEKFTCCVEQTQLNAPIYELDSANEKLGRKTNQSKIGRFSWLSSAQFARTFMRATNLVESVGQKRFVIVLFPDQMIRADDLARAMIEVVVLHKYQRGILTEARGQLAPILSAAT